MQFLRRPKDESMSGSTAVLPHSTISSKISTNSSGNYQSALKIWSSQKKRQWSSAQRSVMASICLSSSIHLLKRSLPSPLEKTSSVQEKDLNLSEKKRWLYLVSTRRHRRTWSINSNPSTAHCSAKQVASSKRLSSLSSHEVSIA